MLYQPRESALQNISESALLRILYSQWDIQQALSALTFLLEDCEFEKPYSRIELRRFRCYEANMVVSFARPFEKSRGYAGLSLKTVGIKLDKQEQTIMQRLLDVRRREVAHSDVEMMHFRSTTFTISELDGVVIPHVVHDHSLAFEEHEYRQFEVFFRALVYNLGDFIFKLAQKNPDVLEFYKKPNNSRQQDAGKTGASA